MGTRYIIRFGDDYPLAGSSTGTLVRVPRAADITGVYPSTVGPLVLGRAVDDGDTWSSLPSAGWSAGNDEALRGFARRANGSAAVSLRIDPPEGAGDYRVWYGTAVTYTPRRRVRVNDGVGGTNLSDVSYAGGTGYPSDAELDADFPNGPAWQQWVDHAGVVRAMGADVFAAISAPIEVTTTGAALEITLGAHASGAFNSSLSFLAFEKIDVGPSISAISPTAGRATGTVIDITVDDSTGATGAAVNGDPLVSFSIVNGTTVRGTTDGATTGAVTVTNAEGTGTGPTFTVVPVADAFRIVGTAPWAPAAGPVLGVEYVIQVEAWDSVLGVRDTAFTGPITIGVDILTPPPTVVSGNATENAVAGVATFTVTFSEGVTPPPSAPPVVQRIPIFTTQPVVAAAGAGIALSTQPIVTVRDSAGNTLTGYTGAVTLRARGGLLLRGATTVNAVAGVATFSGLVPYLVEGGQFRGRLEAVLDSGEAGQSNELVVLAPGQPVYQRTRVATIRDWHTTGAFQIVGAVSGGPIYFEATLDGTNYTALSASPIGGGAAVTQATAAGIWRFDPDGLRRVRLRLDNAVSTEPTLIINLESE